MDCKVLGVTLLSNTCHVTSALSHYSVQRKQVMCALAAVHGIFPLCADSSAGVQSSRDSQHSHKTAAACRSPAKQQRKAGWASGVRSRQPTIAPEASRGASGNAGRDRRTAGVVVPQLKLNTTAIGDFGSPRGQPVPSNAAALKSLPLPAHEPEEEWQVCNTFPLCTIFQVWSYGIRTRFSPPTCQACLSSALAERCSHKHPASAMPCSCLSSDVCWKPLSTWRSQMIQGRLELRACIAGAVSNYMTLKRILKFRCAAAEPASPPAKAGGPAATRGSRPQETGPGNDQHRACGSGALEATCTATQGRKLPPKYNPS